MVLYNWYEKLISRSNINLDEWLSEIILLVVNYNAIYT